MPCTRTSKVPIPANFVLMENSPIPTKSGNSGHRLYTGYSMWSHDYVYTDMHTLTTVK